MKNILRLKNELKTKAQIIREARAKLKTSQRKGSYTGSQQWGLETLKSDYRHQHIAYCELRGKTREQIEKYHRDDNAPNETVIAQIKETYAWTPEEIEAYEARKNQNEDVRNHS